MIYQRKQINTCFTLIELMVVVTIIAILAAILLPSLNLAKKQAQSTFCINNLKQMGQAAISYTVDCDSSFPVAYWNNPMAMRSVAWDVTRVGLISNASYEPGLLWYYVGISSNDNEVNQCPGYTGSDMWAGEAFTGYNYNTSYIGHGQGEFKKEPATAAMVKHPSETVIFGDAGYEGGMNANKFMRAPFGDKDYGDIGFSGRSAGTQHFRHLGYSNAAFVDGHVTGMKQIYQASYVHEMQNVYGMCGWYSIDDSLYDLE